MFLVSVVIPTYNRAELLYSCLRSVRQQRYANWEILVVDDGSTDNTKQLVQEMHDARVKYLEQPNRGAASARNLGARVAVGDYLIFLDSDDVAEPGWLSELTAAVRRDEDVVCCGYRRFGPNGSFLEERTHLKGTPLQRRYGIFLAGTYLVKRSVFLALGGFDESLKSGHHTELAIRIIQGIDRGDLVSTCLPSSLVRINDHGGDKIRKNWSAVFQGSQRILEKHRIFMQESTMPWLLSYYIVLAHAAHQMRQPRDAIRYGWKAVWTRPWSLKNWLRFARYLLPRLA